MSLKMDWSTKQVSWFDWAVFYRQVLNDTSADLMGITKISWSILNKIERRKYVHELYSFQLTNKRITILLSFFSISMKPASALNVDSMDDNDDCNERNLKLPLSTITQKIVFHGTNGRRKKSCEYSINLQKINCSILRCYFLHL